MAVTAKMYGNFILKLLNKEIDFDTDQIKVMLCTSAYVPNQDTHDYLDDITSEVASGNGYTTGGAALANVTMAYDAATNVVKLDADDVTWSASTITARYAVIYDNTPATTATKPLIGYIDFGEDRASSAGNFTIQWAPEGIARFTVA